MSSRFSFITRINMAGHLFVKNKSNKTKKKKKKKRIKHIHIFTMNPLTLSTLSKIFSRRHFEIFFLFFPENRI